MEYYRFGIKITIGFFTLGTIILVLFAITLSTTVAFVGSSFLITAVVINWFYIAIVLFKLLSIKISIALTLKTIGVMMLNIPVAIFYVWCARLLSDGVIQ